MRSRPHMLRLAVAVAALCAAAEVSAAGRTRISVAGVRKDTRGAVAAQLSAAVCGTFECVPAARVKRAGALSFEAVRSERVAGVLFGTVAASKARRNLELALLTTSLRPRRTWVLPLDAKGRLARRDLDRVVAELEGELVPPAPAATAPPPARVAPPPPPPPPPPAPPAHAAEAPRPRPERVEAAPRPTASPDRPARTSRPAREPVARTPAAEPRAVRPPFGLVDAGVRFTRRDLSYSGVGTGAAELQKFKADGIVSPAVRLELHPLALATDRWPASVAVLASYATSVGFEAEESARPGVTHSASLSELELGAGYRLLLGPVSVLPRVTWRKLTLEVKAAQGATIAGLPDADLSGPSFGLDVDVPITGRLGVFGGFAYTRWTTAKDLVGGSPKFFPSGSASALDVDAGVSVVLIGPLSIRAALEWSRTSYSLSGTSSYVATGATDSYLGGSVAARLKF